MILVLAVVAGVLGVGVISLAWREHQLASRVGELEDRLAALETTGERGRRGSTVGTRGGDPTAERREGRRAPRAQRSRPPQDDPTTELDESRLAESLAAPEARQMIEDVVADYSVQEREDRRLRREEYVTDRVRQLVDGFAEAQGLDEETASQLEQEMLTASAERMALRSAMMDGDLDAEEMRAERDRQSAASDERLLELLGEETFEALQAEMETLRFGPR